MKARTWQTKNTEKHEYKTAMGTTDYNIPMFGYRSALFIFVAIITVLFIVPSICSALGVDYRMPTTIIGGLTGGFAVAFSQYFIERKIGLCKGFWMVAGLLSVATGVVIFLMYFTGLIL